MRDEVCGEVYDGDDVFSEWKGDRCAWSEGSKARLHSALGWLTGLMGIRRQFWGRFSQANLKGHSIGDY